jgi:hypothetical protein
MQVILDKVHPTQGREIHVEKIDAIYNWTEWFSAVGLEMSGIASTHLEPEANHCWRWGNTSGDRSCLPRRIIRRGDLPGYVECCEEDVGWNVVVIEDCKPQTIFPIVFEA